MSIVIRMANQDDLENLIRIRYDCFDAMGWNVTPNMKTRIDLELEQYYKEHLNRDLFVAVVEEKENFVASAFLVVNCVPASPSWPTGKTGLILNVWTKLEYRRKGLASRLMQLLIEEAKRRELSCLKLSASEMGVPLYEKLGFQKKDLSHSTEMILEFN